MDILEIIITGVLVGLWFIVYANLIADKVVARLIKMVNEIISKSITASNVSITVEEESKDEAVQSE